MSVQPRKPHPKRRPDRPASAVRPQSQIRNPRSAIQTDWGGVAEWYDRLVGDEGSEYHREVVLPGVVRLLALAPGASVVDVACGQGVLARQLHERGLKVTGVDAAPELIRAARDRGPADIPYHVADARDLSFLPANAREHLRALALSKLKEMFSPIMACGKQRFTP